MCFQEKMLAAYGNKETDSGVRSFRCTWTGRRWQWKVDRPEICSHALLGYRFLDLHSRLFDGKWSENDHVSDKAAEREVGFAIGTDKLQGILGFAPMRSFRIGVHNVGKVGRGNQTLNELHIEPHCRTLER